MNKFLVFLAASLMPISSLMAETEIWNADGQTHIEQNDFGYKVTLPSGFKVTEQDFKLSASATIKSKATFPKITINTVPGARLMSLTDSNYMLPIIDYLQKDLGIKSELEPTIVGEQFRKTLTNGNSALVLRTKFTHKGKEYLQDHYLISSASFHHMISFTDYAPKGAENYNFYSKNYGDFKSIIGSV